MEAAAYTGCGGVTVPVINAAYEQQVVELVNAERLANGNLPPYKRVGALDNAARYHAADMALDNYFDHNTNDRVNGSLAVVCSWDVRVGKYYSGVRGENIAAGYPNPASVMAGWMGSAGHRANILSTSPWEIGVGYYNGAGDYGSYWVENFGKRSGVYPLVINREAASTDSPNVSLYIYGSWTQVRLRNENGPWSAWQPFQNNISWTLSPCGGTKTVSAELQSASASASSSDNITLNSSTAAVLGGLPAGMSFTYSIADGRMYPPASQLTPQNLCSSSMAWTASKNGTWIALSAASGTTPALLTVTPTGFNPAVPGAFNGSVTVSGPAGAGGSPQTISLTLNVVDAPWRSVYLPAILK